MNPDKPSSAHANHFYISMSIVVLLSFIVRLHGLDSESLWMDEIRQVSYYPAGFIEIIRLAAEQSQPPLDYWVGKIFFNFSTTDFSVRMPSALFGTFSVLMLTLLLSKYGNGMMAIVTGLFLSILPFHLYYSQEVRPYAIAIFLFIVLQYTLLRLVNIKQPNAVDYLLLVLSMTLLLFSRALSPLCILIALVLFTLYKITHLKFIKSDKNDAEIKKYSLILGCLALSLLLYLPILLNLLHAASSIANTQDLTDFRFIWTGIREFTLLPLWQAYFAQLEPIGMLVLIGVIGGILLSFSGKNRNILLSTSVYLLTTTSLIHAFIYHAMTDYPFRPAYAIYLLPLCLIIAALFFSEILLLIKQRLPANPVNATAAVIIAGLLIFTANQTIASKNTPNKTDWRSLADQMNAYNQDDTIFLFDAISPFNSWKPLFYGTLRYPVGDINAMAVNYFQSMAHRFKDAHHQPVLILFQYREYKLTGQSLYPLVPIPETIEDINLNFLDNSSLEIQPLRGLWIITTRDLTGNFLYDSYRIMKLVTFNLPVTDSTLDLFLAFTSLSALCETNKEVTQELLDKIDRETGPSAMTYIHNAFENINSQFQEKQMVPDDYCTP